MQTITHILYTSHSIRSNAPCSNIFEMDFNSHAKEADQGLCRSTFILQCLELSSRGNYSVGRDPRKASSLPVSLPGTQLRTVHRNILASRHIATPRATPRYSANAAHQSFLRGERTLLVDCVLPTQRTESFKDSALEEMLTFYRLHHVTACYTLYLERASAYFSRTVA